MLKFFRYNYLIQWVVIVVIAIIAWLPVFLRMHGELPAISGTTPLYFLLAGLIGQSSLIMSIIAFVVFVFLLFFFNTILSSNQLSSRNSTFGSLAFIVCFTCVPIDCGSFQFILACPFVLVAMQTMYSLLQTENLEMYLFNVGVFVALASMFYYPSIVLILWILLVMIVWGYRSFRLFLIPLFGLLMPYFVMFAVSYFKRCIPAFFDTYSSGFCGVEIHKISLTMQDMIVLSVLAVLFLLSYVKIKTSANNSIHIRKRIGVTLLLFVFAVFMMTMQPPLNSNGLIFVVLAIFFAMALSTIRKSNIVSVLVLIVMIGALATQYLPLFL